MMNRPEIENVRDNKKGSVFQRADGRWAACISLGRIEGKRQRKTLYGENRADVLRKLNAAIVALQKELQNSHNQNTVKHFLESWLVNTAMTSLRPKTFESYQELIKLHLVPAIGHIQLSELSPDDIREFLDSKRASGLSPRRIQYIHAVLRRALVQAEKLGLVSRNVAKLINAPHVEPRTSNPFTPAEAREFVQAIEGERLEALFYLALVTGLRQGEILGLSWENIDLTEHQVSVRTSLQNFNGSFQLMEPKTLQSKRTVASPGPLVTRLRSHRTRQLEERLRAGAQWKDTGLVFTTPTGHPLSASHVRRQFYNILSRSGIRKQRFHDLRHTCASLLLSQNVHPRVVMEALGHSTINMTMGLYGHLMFENHRDAAAKMSQLLGK